MEKQSIRNEYKKVMITEMAGAVILIAIACLSLAIAGATADITKEALIVISCLTGAVIAIIVAVGTLLIRKHIKKENARVTAKNVILSRASHDMRTPMNAIINYSSKAMTEDLNPKELKANLAKINDSGSYLMTLIDDLLTMSKVDDHQFKLDEKPATIASLVDPVIEMCKARFQEKHQSFNLEYKNIDQYRYVLVDGPRIQQVLMNLLSNATKYTPESGHIFLLLEGKTGEGQTLNVDIHVKDDGMGISKEDMKMIFKPYEQVASENNTGLGLGLSIVRSIVKMMDGHIKVSSREGEGAEFTVSFNWIYCNKTPDDEVTHDFSILKGKNILLVEDNVMNVEIATALLENQEMSVDVANDGRQGVAMFTHAMPHTYDAILMDIQMPIMNGLEATQLIRGCTHPEAEMIPIIAITADAFDDDREKSAKAGMNAHITKPINGETLYITLANCLGQGH